jgi:hypothetical protein
MGCIKVRTHIIPARNLYNWELDSSKIDLQFYILLNSSFLGFQAISYKIFYAAEIFQESFVKRIFIITGLNRRDLKRSVFHDRMKQKKF